MSKTDKILNDFKQTIIDNYNKGRADELKSVLQKLDNLIHTANLKRGGFWCKKEYLQKENWTVEILGELREKLKPHTKEIKKYMLKVSKYNGNV